LREGTGSWGDRALCYARKRLIFARLLLAWLFFVAGGLLWE
jgi:hypothetical protein